MLPIDIAWLIMVNARSIRTGRRGPANALTSVKPSSGRLPKVETTSKENIMLAIDVMIPSVIYAQPDMTVQEAA